MLTEAARVPLGSRAWLADGLYGATVAADGTLDWLAPLAGAPLLWRLVDEHGPAVRVGPRRDGGDAGRRLPPSALRYLAGTNVAENVMTASGGRRVAVVDFVPWPPEGGSGRVVRLVRALAGPVEVEVEVHPGPARGLRGERRQVRAAGTSLAMGGLEVHAPADFVAAPVGREERWRALCRLDTGEEMVVVVGAGPALGLDAARDLLARTAEAWRRWLDPLYYGGSYRPAVERALLAVRGITGPGGAPAAAGTTSLPRRPGSERTADDRWVRLRDVTRAARLLAAAGMAEDAVAAEDWLRRTVEGADRPWPSWYTFDGQPVPEPEDLPMEGWRRSGPVRSGRPAGLLDAGLVGDVVAAVGASTTGPWSPTPDDPGPLSAAIDALAAAVDHAADHWRHPDNGPWEIERPRRIYTAGRLRVWSALDGLARRVRAANPLDLRATAWQQETHDLLTWLERAAGPGVLTMEPGSDEADAALLAGSGPWPVDHPVITATLGQVLERLGSGGLLHRYSDRVADERSGPDHPDLEASLLAATALGRHGRWDEGHERLEAVLSLAGEGVGLLTETADPVGRQLYGNLPCTAAGLALIEAALELERGPR